MSQPSPASEQLLLWMPVLHAGYQRLLDNLPHAQLLLLGPGFAQQFRVLRKEIRALDAHTVARYLQAENPQRPVRVVEPPDLPSMITTSTLHLPAEDLLRELASAYTLEQRVDTLVWHKSFLRWDREWSTAAVPPSYDGMITTDAHAQLLQQAASQQGELSSDWWRQVGALAVRDGQIVLQAHNQHLPSPYSPYLDGDPRNNFSRGVAMQASTALHAEAGLIAQAARAGVSLAGADLHVSTFPCPACARLIAAAGFARCYFTHGYSVLAGEQVLRSAAVELIWVDPSVGSEQVQH